MQIITLLFTATVHKYIYPSVNNMNKTVEILKVQANGPLPKRGVGGGRGGGSKLEYPEKKPRQPARKSVQKSLTPQGRDF